MKKLACAAFALLLILISPFARAFDEEYYSALENDRITLNVYNWGEYISDGSDDSLDVNSEFEELTGINVHYTTFASNEEMYAKIKSGGAQYDVIVPSEYMIARMINEGMLEKLDLGNIPNLALVGDSYKSLGHDPDNAYSVPYMWGMTGLIYNTAMTDEEIDSWDVLWDSRYMGDILMFSNSRDAFGIAEKRLGYSMNTSDPEKLTEVADSLKEQKLLVQAYVMDEIYNKMGGGEAVVAPYYAGDAVVMMDDNPDLKFVYPKEGSNLFVDAFVIPAGSPNKRAAEMYINFMSEPEISAANANYIGYFTPIPDAEPMVELDESIYPSEEHLAKSEVYEALPEKANEQMDRLWTEILSFNEESNRWIGPVFLFGCFAGSIVIMILRARKKKMEIY